MAAMFESLARAFVYAIETYAGLGLIFAVPLVCVGVQRLDPAAQGSGIAFRLLILPGVTALWPIFVYRWRQAMVQSHVKKRTGD
jgi:hypothetical protein